ncbi:hypothetical protein [Sphingomonas sp. HMP6]|uniref:hypothetical protein n=1 Tax=Sphingomonas sp. HMP6 TaxID=1517551 RepID=UPI0015967C72|nr:hypothetical protein [Sphingomonas sp. HMP6]
MHNSSFERTGQLQKRQAARFGGVFFLPRSANGHAAMQEYNLIFLPAAQQYIETEIKNSRGQTALDAAWRA